MALPQQAASEEIVFDADEKTIENAKTSRSFDVPDDDYMVKIEEATGAKSKSEGKKLLKIKYTIHSEDTTNGLHLWDNIPMEGRGFPDMLLQRCYAANYDVSKGKDGKMHVDPSRLAGLYLGVTVKNKEYPLGSGKVFPKVVRVFNLKKEEQAAPTKQ